jgi:hypothetical protein
MLYWLELRSKVGWYLLELIQMVQTILMDHCSPWDMLYPKKIGHLKKIFDCSYSIFVPDTNGDRQQNDPLTPSRAWRIIGFHKQELGNQGIIRNK